MLPIQLPAPVPDGGPPVVPTGGSPVAALIAALIRRRWLIVGCVLACGAAGAAFTGRLRPVFEAASVVRFEVEQVDLPQLVQVVASDNLIRTEIEVVNGRSVLEALVDSLALRARVVEPRRARKSELFTDLRVGPRADTGTYSFRRQDDSTVLVATGAGALAEWQVRVGEPASIGSLRFTLGPAASTRERFTVRVDRPEDALERVRADVKVARPARDADLITIRVRSTDPVEAAAMANLLATGLIERRRDVRRGRTVVAAAFLQEQAESLGAQLRRAEHDLQTYREREHVVDVPEQARAQVARLANLQAELSVIRADRDAFASLVDQLRRDSTGRVGGESLSRRLMAFPALLENQSAATLLGSLAVVENERAALLVRRLPGDPDVQIHTRRIAEIERQLGQFAEAYLQSLSNQVARREAEAEQFAAQLDALPEKALQTARREREAKILNDLWVLVQTRLKEAEITGAAVDPAVRLVDAAGPPALPIRPRPAVNLALALVLGGLIGVLVALARDAADRSVRSRADVRAAGGLPVLAAFPRIRPATRVALPWIGRPVQPIGKAADRDGDRPAAAVRSRLVTRPGTARAYAEAFHQLFASLDLANRHRPLKVIVFTSPLPGEGKTLSAANFALTVAARGLRVLLIDADLRCGMIDRVFGCRGRPGLAEVLGQTASVDQAIHRVPAGDDGCLVVLPAGAPPRLPGRVLTRDRLDQLIGRLSPEFDWVVIDSPPINLVSDPAVLGSGADGVIVVARAGRTPAEAIRYAVEQLGTSGSPVVGLLLNDVDLRRNAGDDESYRYLAAAERYHAAAV